MERQAILFATSESSGDQMRQLLAMWRDFLVSGVGGAWPSNCIVDAFGFSRPDLLNEVKKAGSAEYALIVYVGKGKSVKLDVPWSELQLELGKGETVLERELNTGSPRCAMILDAYAIPSQSCDSQFASNVGGKNDQEVADRIRGAYDHEIEMAERGLARIWVTSTDQATETDPSLSVEIVQRATKWSTANSGILSFPRAVELVEKNGRACTVRKVEYRGGRRVGHFPFAIGLLG